MRGKKESQRDLLALINLEDRIPQRHPIRLVKAMVDTVLERLSGEFDRMYAQRGRPSIPPERLLKAKVLSALYSVRSDRQFCERLNFDLLFQWFLDMNPHEAAFDASTFSKNMDRLLGHRIAELFFMEVVELAQRQGWVSSEHFSVDGTLIEAWASIKSFRPKDEEPPPPGASRNDWVDFKGQKRSNDTHQSTSDPEARLMRKGPGKEAKLSYGAHAVMENRTGLCVLIDVRPACGEGCAEHEVASDQIDELTMRGFDVQSVGADKGYHTGKFVRECRDRFIAPHVARVSGRKTPGLDGRTARSEAYKQSQRARKRIENLFGWMKTTGALRKSRYRGVERTHHLTQFVAATANLIRMAKLLGQHPRSPLCPAVG